MQDDLHARQVMPPGVLSNALDYPGRDRSAHPLGLQTPGLVGHLIDVAVRTRQVAAAVHLHNELLEGNRLVADLAESGYVEVQQRPRSGMWVHASQPARSSGSLWPPR